VLGTRTRWLTEEEEEERIAKASTAGANSVVNFLQGGHQFEMKADRPMSTQQREEARKAKTKDEEAVTGMGCTCSAAPYPVRLDAWPQGHC
jgi:hydroxymethylpyrimidine/phosphomethylpyrimidine kinase